MRTATADELALLATEHPRGHLKVEIEDSTGAFRNWTDLFGNDLIVSAEWGDSVAEHMISGSVTLNWKHFDDNASPFRTLGSAFTQRLLGFLDNAGSGGGEQRKIQISFKNVPDGDDPDDWDWQLMVDGVIDDMDLANNPSTVKFRDRLGAGLNNQFIRENTVQGTTGPMLDIEDVIDDILTDWEYPAVLLSAEVQVPSATGFGVNRYNQQKMTLGDATRRLANSIGWIFKPRWYEPTSEFQIVLEQPDRSVVATVHTFEAIQYFKFTRFANTVENVRNFVRVFFGDVAMADDLGNDLRGSVVRVDATTAPVHDENLANVTAGSSVDLYGVRYMELAEGATSTVKSTAEAQALADAAISDLSDPTLQFGIQLINLFWPIQVNDFYTFEPDGDRFDSDQDLAVVEWRHVFDSAGAFTVLGVQGKPTMGRENWLRSETRPGQAAPGDDLSPFLPTLAVTNGALHGQFSFPYVEDKDWREVMIYRANTAAFTPSAANLVGATRANWWRDAMLDPTLDWFYQMKVRDRSGNISAASNEVQHVPTGMPATYLEADLTSAFRAEQTSTQQDVEQDVQILFDTYKWGADGDFTLASDRFTAPQDGVYLIHVAIRAEDGITYTTMQAKITRDPVSAAVDELFGNIVTNASNDDVSIISQTLALDSGDVIEVRTNLTGGGTPDFNTSGDSETFFAVVRTLGIEGRT